MLMQIDGTFIFVIISFLIFLLIIKAILYQPITKVLSERENFFAKNSKMEQDSIKKAKELIEDRDNKIKKSRLEAGEIIKTTSFEAKQKGSKLIKQTKKEVQKEIEENRINLEQQSFESKKELKAEVRGFVQSIVSKILGEQVEVDIDEAKINEYLKI